METYNVISTPDINGNIGSCTSRVVRVNSGRTVWKQNYKEVVTNSCTGQVTEYQNWQLTDITIGFIFTGVMLIIVLLAYLGSRNEDKKEQPYDY